MLSSRSNIDSVIAKVLDRIHQLQPGGAAYDTAMHDAADTQLTSCVQRIHTGGIASDGSDIGQYSTTPIYINPKNSPSSFQPAGKTGRAIFASTGQPHLTRYFDQGYRNFRQEIGLAADKVVLTLRGDLRDGLTVMQTPKGYALGWPDETLYTLSQSLEKKYAKPIWAPTSDEKAAIIKSIRDKVGEVIK